MPHTDAKGQSTVAPILLVGLVMVVGSLSAPVFLDHVGQSSVGGPLADLEIETGNGKDIVINHRGGEPINTESVKIVVDDSTLTTLSDADTFDGNQNGRFSLGESVTHTADDEGVVKVAVVDKDTGKTVAHRTIMLSSISGN